jgi:hypothetical protein
MFLLFCLFNQDDYEINIINSEYELLLGQNFLEAEIEKKFGLILMPKLKEIILD